MPYQGGKSHQEDPVRKRMAVLEERFEDVRRVEGDLVLFTSETWEPAIRQKLRSVSKAYDSAVKDGIAATARKDVAKLNASADIASFEVADMHRRHLELSFYAARQGAEIAQALLDAERAQRRSREVERVPVAY